MGRITVTDLAAVDLNLLRVFAAIARERSVTRAGEQIAMSQPAVSGALTRLRALLDDQLFVRRGNDMVPTPRAEELIGPIQEALDRLQEALQVKRAFDPATAKRTVTIIGPDFFSMLLMPQLAARCVVEAPGVRLRLLDSGRGDRERLLLDDAADVVLEGPLQMPEWVSRQTLFVSRFVIVARKDHPRLRAARVKPGDTVPIDLFCDLPHALRTVDGGMTGQTDAALASQGRSRRVVLVVPHFHAVLMAVSRSDLIAAIPRAFAESYAPALGVGIYRAPIDLPEQDIQMYWHSRHDRDGAHRWVRGLIAEAATQWDSREAPKPSSGRRR